MNKVNIVAMNPDGFYLDINGEGHYPIRITKDGDKYRLDHYDYDDEELLHSEWSGDLEKLLRMAIQAHQNA